MKHPIADQDVQEQAHNFLKKHPLAVVSTVSDDGMPWGAAVYAVADEDFNFFFVTREQTQKFQNIDSNTHVALTFANPESQITIQVSGTVAKVPSKEIVDVVFKKLASVRPKGDINWMPPVVKVHQGDWMVLQLTPTYAQFADYKAHVTRVDESYIFSLV